MCLGLSVRWTKRRSPRKVALLLLVVVGCCSLYLAVHTNDKYDVRRTSGQHAGRRPLGGAPFHKHNTTVLRQLYSYLNLTENQGPAHIAATIECPLLLGNDGLCATDDGRSVDVLFVVHSAPLHFDRRLMIRSTYGAARHFKPYEVRTVFILGEVSNDTVQSELQKEHRSHMDLVQGAFVDSYRNLSLKGVLGFRWVTHHCPRAGLVVKLDDDVFFDTFKLLHRYWPEARGRRRSFFCSVWPTDSMPILREGKWGVEEHVFRNLSRYPFTYCSGLAIIMTPDMLPALYAASKVTPTFWISDMFLFGVLPAVASNVTYYSVGYRVGGMELRWYRALRCMRIRGYNCRVLAASAMGEEFMEMWAETTRLRNGFSWQFPLTRV